MRAVIYARYSSQNQREASIEDQVRVCQDRIEREGWTLFEVYSDAAISGATTLRPGYQKMLEDARNGGFDIVIAEALDRLSRDLADIAGLYKQLTFSGTRLFTLAEGETYLFQVDGFPDVIRYERKTTVRPIASPGIHDLQG